MLHIDFHTSSIAASPHLRPHNTKTKGKERVGEILYKKRSDLGIKRYGNASSLVRQVKRKDNVTSADKKSEGNKRHVILQRKTLFLATIL